MGGFACGGVDLPWVVDPYRADRDASALQLRHVVQHLGLSARVDVSPVCQLQLPARRQRGSARASAVRTDHGSWRARVHLVVQPVRLEAQLGSVRYAQQDRARRRGGHAARRSVHGIGEGQAANGTGVGEDSIPSRAHEERARGATAVARSQAAGTREPDLVEQHPVPQIGVQEVRSPTEKVLTIIPGQRLVHLDHTGRRLERPRHPQPPRRTAHRHPRRAVRLVGGDHIGTAVLADQRRQPVRRAVRQCVRHPATRAGRVAVRLRDKRCTAGVEAQAERRLVDTPAQGRGRGGWHRAEGRHQHQDQHHWTSHETPP